MVEGVVRFMFLLNLMEDLVLFMDWPDQKQFLTQQASEKEAFLKMRRLTANSRW